ncbi:MAG: hypothetical protein IJZ29_02935 [Clostridia bacterium]|nr:hypothetical protein [Clostridia bacterium]
MYAKIEKMYAKIEKMLTFFNREEKTIGKERIQENTRQEYTREIKENMIV